MKFKKMLTTLFIILIPVLLFGLYVAGTILYATLTDYRPKEIEEVEIKKNMLNLTDSTFTFMIWNIGYGGLGEDVDFFYDGGKSVISPKNLVSKYQNGIYEFIESNRDIDFVLLQEVDLHSKRSHKTNEMEAIAERLPFHGHVFAMNYMVNFVPLPFTNPLGGIQSGLASFSRYAVSEAKRFSFPGNFDWPKRVFFLDRCFLLQRIKLANQKELIVINTHNSAYDDGTLKAKQMDYLKNFLEKEHAKGNYIVVGGDWNQCPPDFDADFFNKKEKIEYHQLNVESDYMPGNWQWIYDKRVATNRKLKTPYSDGISATTIIDFYLVSPNLEVLSVDGIDLKFKFSDHQPVKMIVKLKEE